jgi:uncharacterized protein (TIGR00106 family)
VKVIVDLCVVPIGVGVHLAPYIAACEKVLSEAGLKVQLHPNGTAIEGEWEPVFAAIEACHEAVHAMGCPRVYTTVKINTPARLENSVEEWPYLDEGTLLRTRSRKVCMTCHWFRHHAGVNCIPVLTCQLHQGLIAHGEHWFAKDAAFDELVRDRFHRQGSDPGGQGGQRAGASVKPGLRAAGRGWGTPMNRSGYVHLY